MAGSYNIKIDQGSVWDLALLYQDDEGAPIDLTGYGCRMQWRAAVSDESTLLSVTESDPEITLGGVFGTIALHLDATTTAGFSFAKAVFDIELIPGGVEADATRIMQGTVTIDPEVTR